MRFKSVTILILANLGLLIFSLLWIISGTNPEIDQQILGTSTPFSIGHDFHLFGTDYFGFDVFELWVKGFTYSFVNAISVLFFSSLIAFLMAFPSAYYGNHFVKFRRMSAIIISLYVVFLFHLVFVLREWNWILILVTSIVTGLGVYWDYSKGKTKPIAIPLDNISTATYKWLSSLPKFILLIVMILFFEPNWIGFVLILASLTWVQKARIMRAEILRLKEMNYVESAKALGLRDSSIMLRHILGNMWSTLGVTWIYAFANLFLLDAGLSFLGLNAFMDVSTWGSLLAQYKYDLDAWWLLAFPALGLIIFILPLFSIAKNLESKSLEKVHF